MGSDDDIEFDEEISLADAAAEEEREKSEEELQFDDDSDDEQKDDADEADEAEDSDAEDSDERDRSDMIQMEEEESLTLNDEDDDAIFEPRVTVLEWIELNRGKTAVAVLSTIAILLAIAVVLVTVVVLAVLLSGGSSDTHTTPTGDACSGSACLAGVFWSTYRGNMGHNGFLQIDSSAPAGSMWDRNMFSYTSDEQMSEPVLHPNGYVLLSYTHESSAQIVAYDAHNAKKLWHSMTSRMMSGIVVAPDGSIFANSVSTEINGNDEFTVLDADGNLLWSGSTPYGDVVASNIVPSSDSSKAYFLAHSITGDYTDFILNAVNENGILMSADIVCELNTMIADMPTGHVEYGYTEGYGYPLTMSDDGKMLYISCGGMLGASVFGYSTETLEQVSIYNIPDSTDNRQFAPPTISGDMLIVSEQRNGAIYAFDLTSQRALWNVRLWEVTSHNLPMFGAIGVIVADPTDSSRLYLRGRVKDETRSTIICFDGTDGSIIWAVNMQEYSSWEFPLVFDPERKIIYVALDNKIVLLNAKTGSEYGSQAVPTGNVGVVASPYALYVVEASAGNATLHAISSDKLGYH